MRVLIKKKHLSSYDPNISLIFPKNDIIAKMEKETVREKIGIEQAEKEKQLTRGEFLRLAGLFVVSTLTVPPLVRFLLEKSGKVEEGVESLPEVIFRNLRCDIRVVEDIDLNYDVNIEEVRRLITDNQIDARYLLDIKIQTEPVDFDGLSTTYGRRWRREIRIGNREVPFINWEIIHVSTADFMGKAPPNHDYSIVENLTGVERQRWKLGHEIGHVIQDLKGLPTDDELWCDQFANENYQKYKIIVEQPK